jgi:hypothetical protein
MIFDFFRIIYLANIRTYLYLFHEVFTMNFSFFNRYKLGISPFKIGVNTSFLLKILLCSVLYNYVLVRME